MLKWVLWYDQQGEAYGAEGEADRTGVLLLSSATCKEDMEETEWGMHSGWEAADAGDNWRNSR